MKRITVSKKQVGKTMLTCASCGNALTEIKKRYYWKDPFLNKKVDIGEIEYERCNNCNEDYFPPTAVASIEKAIQDKMKKTTKADKFNTEKFDKRIKIKSNHVLKFGVGQEFKVDGVVYKVVNTIFNLKKTYVVYLKFLKPEFKKVK